MSNIEKIMKAINYVQAEPEEKKNIINPITVFFAIIGVISTIAGIAYAAYRYFAPNYLEEYEGEDLEDDFDAYFEDEDAPAEEAK